MATRQQRVSDPVLIRQQLSLQVGKKINVVLRNGTAVLGLLKNSNDLHVELVNMAQRSQRYPFSSIAEIYVDSLA